MSEGCEVRMITNLNVSAGLVNSVSEQFLKRKRSQRRAVLRVYY